MTRLRTLLLTGLLAYLVFLVAGLPVRQVYGWFGKRLPGVAAAGLQGSVWSGRAGMVVYRGQSLGAVRWSLRPLDLLAGRLEYGLRWSGPAGDGTGRAGRSLLGGLYVRDVNATLPAASLPPALTGLPVALEGAFRLQLNDARFGAAGLAAASGTLTWEGAGVGGAAPLTLGTYVVKLAPAARGGGIQGTLSDRGGPLQVDGSAHLAPGGAYTLQATVTPRGKPVPALQDGLQLLGRPDAGGRYHLQLAGRL